MTLDRRTVLGWAAVVAGAVGAGAAWRSYTGAPAPGPDAPAAAAAGYGRDPNLTEPAPGPWPRLLGADRRTALGARLETLLPRVGTLPSGVEVGLVDFFDEWLSAPYPDQMADRALILPLLDGQADPAAEKRFRVLALAAFYTTPAGIPAIGFVGNEARASFDPLPPEVLHHLEAQFARLPEKVR